MAARVELTMDAFGHLLPPDGWNLSPSLGSTERNR